MAAADRAHPRGGSLDATEPDAPAPDAPEPDVAKPDVAEPDTAEVVRLRPHLRRLARPLVVLLVGLAAAGYAAAALPPSSRRTGVDVVIALVLLRWSVLPWLRWLCTVLVVGPSGVSYRTGVLRRRSRDLPLTRVLDVEIERSLTQRLLGTGTLVLPVLGPAEPLVVPDVPRVRVVAARLVAQLEATALDDPPEGHDGLARGDGELSAG